MRDAKFANVKHTINNKTACSVAHRWPAGPNRWRPNSSISVKAQARPTNPDRDVEMSKASDITHTEAMSQLRIVPSSFNVFATRWPSAGDECRDDARAKRYPKTSGLAITTQLAKWFRFTKGP